MPLLDVILGYDCNLACDYCTITPEMRTQALDTQTVVATMQRGIADGYDHVSFTGGEPTIRRDLVGLVRAAKKLGFKGIKVQSNGLVFAHAPNLDRILDAGVDRIHISIHTHDPVRYETLVRRTGTYGLMVQSLRNLVDRPVTTVADVIIKADTYRDLPSAIAWLGALGVRAADLWFVSLTDGNRHNVDSMPRMTEVVPAMHEAFAAGRAAGMTLRSLHLPRCLLGDDAVHAFDPGSQKVKVVTPEATFALSESRVSPQRHVPACEGCRFRTECPGVRRDYLDRFGDAEIRLARV